MTLTTTRILFYARLILRWSINDIAEGVNGQLPNLDMINTVAQISEHIAPVNLTLHEELVPFTENMTKNYINSLKRMLYMMKYQAAGAPTGNHGLYLK